MRNILDFARLVDELPDSKLRALGVLLLNEANTRNQDHHMGEKVYVRYRGRANTNYISNFMIAYIMSARKDSIRLMSSDGKICITLNGPAMKTVYSIDDFEPLRKQMISKGRFADPEVHRALQKSLRCQEEYELGLYDEANTETIPTIDTVFKTNKIRKSSRTSDTDLVAIVNAIENLHDAKTVDVERKKRKSPQKRTGGDGSYAITD